MRKMWAGMVSALLVAGGAAAQKITVTGGVLQPGQVVDVTYTDASRAGQAVTVQIDNGDPDNPAIVSVQIQLDGNGTGVGHWVVLAWWGAVFNAPGTNEVARSIAGPTDNSG